MTVWTASHRLSLTRERIERATCRCSLRAEPGVIGHWTNNIIYKRLAPGVWDELKRLTPRTPSGSYKNKLFQRLTEDVGHPKLREHMSAVLMLMKYSPHWRVFMDRLDREFPQWGSNFLLPFPEDYSPQNLPPPPNFIDG
jgi:hypothetical protein